MGKGLGNGGLTINQLLSNGYEAIFVGIGKLTYLNGNYAIHCLLVGLPNPKVASIFNGLAPSNGFYTSKDFLPLVCSASKPGELYIPMWNMPLYGKCGFMINYMSTNSKIISYMI